MFSAPSLFLALVAGAAIYLFSPYHYLSIDVNPSIEVQANRLGKVTGVSAVNDDAEPILQDLNSREWTPPPPRR